MTPEAQALLDEITASCKAEGYRGFGDGHGIPTDCIDRYAAALLAGASYARIGTAAGVSEPAIIKALARAAESGHAGAIEARAAATARRGGRRTPAGAP